MLQILRCVEIGIRHPEARPDNKSVHRAASLTLAEIQKKKQVAG